MNIDQTKAIHGMCMACDPRVQPMDRHKFTERIWSRILADVPFEDAVDVVARLYSRERMIVLQPGMIVEAWEELRAERDKTLRGIASIDRYLAQFAATDPPEVTAERRAQRDRLVEQLPERMRHEQLA